MTPGPRAWLHASGLPGRWRGRDRYVLLDLDAGLLERFIAAWQAWREDPARSTHLHVIALGVTAARQTIEWPSAPRSAPDADLPDGGPPDATAPDATAPDRPLRAQLAAAWPPLTGNLHRLAFEDGRVVLLLAPATLRDALRQLVAAVDGFVGGGFAPAPASPVPGGDALPRLSELRSARFDAKACARLAAPAATWVAWAPTVAERSAWQAAGFVWDAAVAADPLHVARWAPAFEPRRSPGRARPSGREERRAVIVGAGLAGCATAWALAEQGWESLVLDRHDRLAAQASGNPAGLFHGVVNGQDGSHARLHRAAAWQARDAVAIAMGAHGVAGSTAGLLQLTGSRHGVAGMRALLARLGLPPDCVQALDGDAASARAGTPLASDAWFHPAGGWVDPAGLARSFMARAGALAQFCGGVEVATLSRVGERWQLRDGVGALVAEAATVILANAGDAARLAGVDWPLVGLRGQISRWTRAGDAGIALPHLPITGAGYVLPLPTGDLVFGATTSQADADPAVRARDHADNLKRLERLLPGVATRRPDAQTLEGRTAWRCSSPDRLPLIGAVPLAPDQTHALSRADGGASHVRWMPRVPGLHVYTALGSRGITWSAWGAQVLAAGISGAPLPLEADLLDAIDPARFLVRGLRRTS